MFCSAIRMGHWAVTAFSQSAGISVHRMRQAPKGLSPPCSAPAAFAGNAYRLSNQDISFTSRNPINSIPASGSQLNLLADRQFLALLSHEPPRTTFPDADFGPQGSVCESEPYSPYQS